MRDLKIINDTAINKEGESNTRIRVKLVDDNTYPTVQPTDEVSWKIGNDKSFLIDVPADAVKGTSTVYLDTKQFDKLPNGDYAAELWITHKDGTVSKFPSKGELPFTVDRSIADLDHRTVTTITLESLEQGIDAKIDDLKKTVLKGDKGDPGVPGKNGVDGKDGHTPTITLNPTNHKLQVDGVDVGDSLMPTVKQLDLSKYPTKDDLTNELKNYATSDMVFGDATEGKFLGNHSIAYVAAGRRDPDLNTLIDNGPYFCTNNSTNIKHLPSNAVGYNWYFLINYQFNGSNNYVLQRLVEFGDFKEWLRATTNGGSTWDPWHEVTGSASSSTSTASLTDELKAEVKNDIYNGKW